MNVGNLVVLWLSFWKWPGLSISGIIVETFCNISVYQLPHEFINQYSNFKLKPFNTLTLILPLMFISMGYIFCSIWESRFSTSLVSYIIHKYSSIFVTQQLAYKAMWILFFLNTFNVEIFKNLFFTIFICVKNHFHMVPPPSNCGCCEFSILVLL